ncbi:MAG: ATP-grasp domain-containing protein [Chitinophaga sp.]|uniref:ATP-grasp domain-containing protein n=1 Tax=Chitinophaga sp. TaxID=1869181 RepID=UPI001B1C923C|nr:ATP-grasp domain-containing protein [Chitinophaga sp.]MBO9733167.1 ATP-grasp domain-containing protein [Chitinophaga sp.]
MPDLYPGIQWVVQRNLTNKTDLENLQRACEITGVRCLLIEMIPFAVELPDFDNTRRSIFYGSTTLCALVAENKQLQEGLFFDPALFSIGNYLERWGKYMLNDGAVVTTFATLMSREEAPETLFFIRPDDDSKSFAGETKSFGDIKAWYDQLKMVENTNLSLQSPIVVSTPYNIQYEWRLWIVNGKVIAASKYRTYFKLTPAIGCPPEVIAFAESRCEEYMPQAVFVMDVCLCGDEFYIVECNCMNAAGFYKADVTAIVAAVSAHFANIFSS